MRASVTARKIALAALLATAATEPAGAIEPVERARGERLALAGRCEEALPLLARAADDEPGDARLALMTGNCQLRLQRYEEAAASLGRARSLDPKLPDVDLSLAIARFHAGDAEGALAAVADARRAGSTRPELDLYEGLALLELGREQASAARALERAADAGPRTLDPVASYYAALAWRGADEEDRARAALEKVLVEHPDTEWGEAARRALDRAPAAAGPRRWARVSAGVEYDTNVVFRGRGVTLPDEIGDEEDVRAVWSAEVAGELVRRGPWALGVRADYLGTAHADVTDYDLQYPGGGVWADRWLSEQSLVRLDYAYHYGWLGYSSYVSAHEVTPQWIHRFDERGTLRVYGQLWLYDFFQNDGDEVDGPGAPGQACALVSPGITRCGPPGLDEDEERDRDGIGGAVGVEHTLPVEALRGEVWGGAFWEIYESEGTEYQYRGYGVRGGFRSALPARFTLAGSAGYVYRPFEHPSTYPDTDDVVSGFQYALDGDDRSDDVVEVDVELERALTDRLFASVRYAYLWNGSNVAVFDYDRHIVGAYLTWDWSR
jgi:tetratricopeptide (TPR) repeat protein